jgi:hypothetical protein
MREVEHSREATQPKVVSVAIAWPRGRSFNKFLLHLKKLC